MRFHISNLVHVGTCFHAFSLQILIILEFSNKATSCGMALRLQFSSRGGMDIRIAFDADA